MLSKSPFTEDGSECTDNIYVTSIDIMKSNYVRKNPGPKTYYVHTR